MKRGLTHAPEGRAANNCTTFWKSQLLLISVQFHRNEAMRDRKNIPNGGLGFFIFLNGGEICPIYEK